MHYPLLRFRCMLGLVLALSLPASHVLGRSQDTAGEQGQPGYFGRFAAELTNLADPGGVAIDQQGRIFVTESSVDRVAVFDATGRRMTTWGRRGSGPGELAHPTGIAVGPHDLVYVADTDNHRVSVFTADGEPVRQWGQRGAGREDLSGPRGIAVDDRFVYALDTGNCRVQVFEHDGTFARALTSGFHHDDDLSLPIGIAVDAADGLVFIADSDRDFVLVHDGQRRPRHWGGWGTLRGLLGAPGGLAYHGGRLLIADTRNHRVQVLTDLGEPLYQWGQPERGGAAGQGRLHSPSHVAVAPSGEFAVVLEAIENRGQVFTRSHEEPQPSHWRSIDDVHFGNTVGADGVLLAVHEEYGESIAVFDISGNTPVRLTDIGQRGRDVGQLTRPGAIVVDAASREVFVADTANSRIQLFRLRHEPGAEPHYDLFGAEFVKSIELNRRLTNEAMRELTWPVRPTSLARSADGRWFVLDARNTRILRFEPDFRLGSMWGSYGEGPGQLRRPSALAVDAQRERLFVADAGNRRIAAFDLDGHPLPGWSGRMPDPDGLCEPAGIQVLADGGVVVTDRGTGLISRFADDGSWVGSWGGAEGQPRLFKPTGLALAGDRLAVVDHGHQRIVLMRPDGTELSTFEPKDAAPQPLAGGDPLDVGTGLIGSREILSNDGSYLVRWRAEPDPIPVNEPFSVFVEIYEPGDPPRRIEQLLVGVDAAMPHHRHGMLQRPTLRSTGPGAFTFSEMRFHMPGRWHLYVDITEDGITERAESVVVVE